MVLIVGAGPAGLAAAAALAVHGVPCRVVDRTGVAGGAYREMYDGMTLASPRSFNELPGLRLEGAEYTTVPAYRAYLERYAAHHGISVEAGEVDSIARADGGFAVKVSGRTSAVRAVVVASGMWGAPVLPKEIPGIENVPVVHAGRWKGVTREARRILVVGGATSGVEIAEEVARAGEPVWMSTRRPVALVPRAVLGIDLHHFAWPFERLPYFMVRGRCASAPTLPATDLGFSSFRAAGLIQLRPPIARLEPGRAYFVDGSLLSFDLLVAATGYRFSTPFLPAEVTREPAGHLRAQNGESTSWPGLFVLGHPCAFGLGSQFLRGVAQDAPRVARAIARRLARG